MTTAPTLTKTPNWADVEVTSNVPAHDVTRMSVDTKGAAHIMSLLTDLYSDPELAVLREYTSNGIDSHKAARQTKPVEVHLPSALNSNFIVQDYGTGMSLEDIKVIYSSYGASTKRDDLNQIGAFGLGCKSALTLTQQFTLVSVKDGKRTIAHILRGADGVGEISIISHTDTSEPNGVKVTIPVPDHSSFTKKSADFFYTWKTGDVLVNGEKPKSIFDLDHITFVPSNGQISAAHLIRPAAQRGYYDKFDRGLYVMISGIRYQVHLGTDNIYSAVPRPLIDFLAHTSLMIEVPIGSVDLVPSREAIRYSQRTAENIKIFTKDVMQDINKLILADVVDAPTRRAAVERRSYWSNTTRDISNLAFRWGTEDIPKNVRIKDFYYGKFEFSHRARAGYIYRQSDHIALNTDIELNVESLVRSNNVYYTVDQRLPESIKNYKSMFRDYLQGNSSKLSGSSFLHMLHEPTNAWFKEFATRVDIDTMLLDAAAYRVAERATKPKATPTPQDMMIYPTIKIDAKGEITFPSQMAKDVGAGAYYVNVSSSGPGMNQFVIDFIKDRGYSGSSWTRAHYDHIRYILTKQFASGGEIVVVAGARKVEPLLKRNPNITGVNFYAKFVKAASDILSGGSANGLAGAIVLGMPFYNMTSPTSFANGLSKIVGTVNDPMVRELVDIFTIKTTLSQGRIEFIRAITGTTGATKDIIAAAETLKNRYLAILDKYPLLVVLSNDRYSHERSAVLNDLVEYLNYTHGKANKV